jgi:hypothetical protein
MDVFLPVVLIWFVGFGTGLGVIELAVSGRFNTILTGAVFIVVIPTFAFAYYSGLYLQRR